MNLLKQKKIDEDEDNQAVGERENHFGSIGSETRRRIGALDEVVQLNEDVD